MRSPNKPTGGGEGARFLLTLDQYFAWGPDLSGTYNGAGGIGGLAMYLDETAPSDKRSFFPTYDGNGNVTALYRPAVSSTTPPETSSANVILAAAYEYGPFGEMQSITEAEGQDRRRMARSFLLDRGRLMPPWSSQTNHLPEEPEGDGTNLVHVSPEDDAAGPEIAGGAGV